MTHKEVIAREIQKADDAELASQVAADTKKRKAAEKLVRDAAKQAKAVVRVPPVVHSPLILRIIRRNNAVV